VARREILACPGCGTVLDELMDKVADFERDLAAKRRRISVLEGEQARRIELHARYAEAMEVLEIWRIELAPRTRSLKGKRLEYTIARLEEGYEQAQLIECIQGYKSRPYVTAIGRSAFGTKAEKQIDADLIFRDAKHVDRGVALAEAARELAFQQRTREMTQADRMYERLGVA